MEYPLTVVYQEHRPIWEVGYLCRYCLVLKGCYQGRSGCTLTDILCMMCLMCIIDSQKLHCYKFCIHPVTSNTIMCIFYNIHILWVLFLYVNQIKSHSMLSLTSHICHSEKLNSINSTINFHSPKPYPDLDKNNTTYHPCTYTEWHQNISNP